MTALSTEFREAVALELGRALEIDVQPGIIDSPPTGHDVACSWPEAEREVAQDVNQKQIFIRVRYWKQFIQQQDEHVPAILPAPLEQVAEVVQRIVQGQQTHLGPWFARVVSIDYDMRQGNVEFSIMGYGANIGVL